MPRASVFSVMYFFGSILNNRENQKPDHYGGILPQLAIL